MGEYQNRAVALLTARLGTESITDLKGRNEAYLAAAIDLFHALGGSAEELAAVAEAARERPAPAVDMAIGELMEELAAIGTLNDFDIMQAAYNTLDRQRRSIEAGSDADA